MILTDTQGGPTFQPAVSPGRPKRRRALAASAAASSTRLRPRASAIRAAVKGDAGRLVGPAAERVRAEVGAVRLDQEAVERDTSGDLAERVERLVRERDHPGEGEVQAQVEERPRVVPGPGERVQDPAHRPPERGELLDDVALALPAVDHHRQAALVGQVEVAAEPVLLDWKRRLVPVAVEPRLADGDHPRAARPGRRPAPSRPGAASPAWFGCTPTAAKTPGCRPAIATTSALSSAVMPTATTCRTPPARARQDAGQVVAQGRVLEMGVGVDQRWPLASVAVVVRHRSSPPTVPVPRRGTALTPGTTPRSIVGTLDNGVKLLVG